MDEPLSNLDAKLRDRAARGNPRHPEQVGIATIYVTHDQEEALAISDRICVMSGGRDRADRHAAGDLLRDPQTLFVASFVGTMNVLRPGAEPSLEARPAGVRRPVHALAIRPEHVGLAGRRGGRTTASACRGRSRSSPTSGARPISLVADRGRRARGPGRRTRAHGPRDRRGPAGDARSFRASARASAFDADGARVRARRLTPWLRLDFWTLVSLPGAG